MSPFSQNTVFPIFCFKKLIWSLKSKYLSNKRPRYLVQVFCLIFWPLKQKFIFLVIYFLGDQKITVLVLLTFKAILLFDQSHWTRSDRSKFNFLVNVFERTTGIYIIDLHHQQRGVFLSVLLIDLSHLCIWEIKVLT